MRIINISAVWLPLFLIMHSVHAGNVAVVDAKITKSTGSDWSASVTLRHADEGWKHYADAWRIVDANSKVLGTRTLYHPHVQEQPFTRSLGNITIPATTATVFIEAHDKVHGWNKQRLQVNLNHVMGQGKVVRKAPPPAPKKTKPKSGRY